MHDGRQKPACCIVGRRDVRLSMLACCTLVYEYEYVLLPVCKSVLLGERSLPAHRCSGPPLSGTQCHTGAEVESLIPVHIAIGFMSSST